MAESHSLPDLLGAHESAAGGPQKAIDRAREIDCHALQIFVKSPSRWEAKPLDPAAIDAFRQRRAAASIGPVLAHAAYLINLAATEADLLRRSRAALADELRRCRQLGLDALVVHPGAHRGDGEEDGLHRIAETLGSVLEDLPAAPPRVLLENTAGQGTVLGRRLEQLAWIARRLDDDERVGFCLDTCHAFAAGYDLRSEEGREEFLQQVADLLGFERVGCIHCNDSRHPLGSRRDRHANLGSGELGLDPFVALISDSRLAGIPFILETPVGDDRNGHRDDLRRLRRAMAEA